MMEQTSNVVPSGCQQLASTALKLVALMTLMLMLTNHRQIRCNQTKQPAEHKSLTSICSSPVMKNTSTNQLEAPVAEEENKQNSPSTQVLCQTTLEPPPVAAHDNNDSTFQLASTLEPVYFGSYPITSNDNDNDNDNDSDNNHNPTLIHHFRQRPLTSTASSTNNFFTPHSLLNSPNSSPAIGATFYQPKEPANLRYATDDPIAKPVFEQDLTDDQGNGDGQIVTLQAFNSEASDSHRARLPSVETGGRISTTETAGGGSKYHGDLMDILRRLPASKQVQLINGFGSTSSVPLERPSLNLVSGTMRVAAPALSHMVQVGNPRASRKPSGQEQLLELVERIKKANVSPDIGSEQNQVTQTEPSDGTDSTTDPHLNYNNIRDEDKDFLRSLVQGLNIPPGEEESSSLANQHPTTANDKITEQQAIPIARLVDHLMENSRLSTFGVQHEGDGLSELPEEEEEVNPSEEEEEEEEDEEEPENDSNEEAQESGLVLQKHLSPMMQSFSAVLNQSSSWIPLDSLEGIKRPVGLPRNGNGAKRKEKTVDKTDKSKKKAKKKRKKKKRRKKQVLGLIVGDKVFSNADLVRLIEILNKLASKGKTKAERDSSKKLLKYLIKLMLEEYKKNSSGASIVGETLVKVGSVKGNNDTSIQMKQGSAGSIRDLLRPHLESPTTSKDDEPKKADATAASPTPVPSQSKDVEPVVEQVKRESAKLEKLKPNKEEKSEEFKRENKSTLDDTEKKPPEKDNTNSSSLGLDKLTEELEHYFDTDFYEDMADDLDRNRTHISLASGLVGTRLARVPRHRRHRRRPSGLIYTVPIPIYRQQLFEAADEEDTDFDAVTIPVPKRRRQLARRRSYTRRPQALVRRPRKRRGKRPAVEEAEAAEATEAEEEPEEEEPEEDEPEEGKRAPIRQPVEQPVAASDEAPHVELVEQEPEQEPEQEAEPEPEQAEPVELEYIQREKPTKAPVRQQVEPRRRRKRRRRRKSGIVAGGGLGGRRGIVAGSRKEIDYDSRYEIPAPIGAGERSSSIPLHNSSSTTHSRGFNKRFVPRVRQHSLPVKRPAPVQSRKIAASSRRNTRRMNPKTSNGIPKPTTERYRRTQPEPGNMKPAKLSRRRKPPGKLDPDEPSTGEPGPGEADEDYYNDSSSYTKICDDDNKCEVKIHKSGPKKSYRKTEI